MDNENFCQFATAVVSNVFVPFKNLEIEQTNTSNIFYNTSIKQKSCVFSGRTFFYEKDLVLETLMYAASWSPMPDSNVRKDPNEMMKEFYERFKRLFSHNNILIENDSDNLFGTDNNINNDERLMTMIKQGPGALLIEECGPNIFKVDVSHLGNYEVRDGYIKYGGCFYFSNQGPIKIEYGGITYLPSGKEWNWVKYIFKSSLLVKLVIQIHATYYHLVYGSLIPSTIFKLDDTSNIRKFMAPFLYKNLHSAEAAMTVLYGKGRYFHRLFAFTFEALEKYISDSFKLFKYVDFLDKYEFTYKNDITKFYYLEDGRDYYQIIHRYVKKNCDMFSQDDILQFSSLLMKYGNEFYPSDLNIVKLFTNYIVNATMNHEVIGNSILKWQYDPQETSTKLRRGSLEDLYPDYQTYYQTMVIVSGTTMAKVPKLMDDLTYYFSFNDGLDDKRKKKYNKFINDLKKLNNIITDRNKNREIPYYGALPKNLETTFSQ